MSSGTADAATGVGTAPTPERALARLVEAVLSLGPLLGVLPPVTVPAGPRAQALGPLLETVSRRLGTPAVAVAAGPGRPDPFTQVVADRLDLAGLPVTPDGRVEGADRLADIVDDAEAADFGRFCARLDTKAGDGVPLRVYTAGRPGEGAVVLALAPGMPARLAERWIRELARTHYVVTWESRGLFADPGEPAPADYGVTAQAGDLLAAMDRAGATRAHVVGLCGGAVPAVTAAALHLDRITSLSLWHGDFDLGPDSPKTDHQRNLQALMAMACSDPGLAATIHETLCRSLGDNVPADLAHLVLYPYATAELFARYCALNSAVMGEDLRPRLTALDLPVLVVTSTDDHTAHPGGSAAVAAALPGAVSLVRPHGDHISVFRGEPELFEAVAGFLAEHPL
ncbi:alpha/beta hydrolase [Streptomyces sp. NPDC006638]|uniref:alpha/beta fold hydrolase n=1 Tax=Streptomyces sp. NPDC006638 TaxID=3157183 RepID=UPI0033BD99CD